MGNQQQELYQKWNGWLDVLSGELMDLRINQHIFKEVQRIMRDNPRMQTEPDDFYQWMRDIYAYAMSAAIR